MDNHTYIRLINKEYPLPSGFIPNFANFSYPLLKAENEFTPLLLLWSFVNTARKNRTLSGTSQDVS